jgi:hypothetical protein
MMIQRWILTVAISGFAGVIPIEQALARTTYKTIFLAEMSPLRTVMGAPEMRLETVSNAFGAALKWNQERRPSARADYTDQSQIIRIEALWYPFGVADLPFFLGAGLQHEAASIGRQETRSHTTWARTSSDEAYDRWVNQDSYLSLTQSVGYRYISKALFTASISAYRDELVTVQSRNEDASEIYSSNPDLDTKGRSRLLTGVTLSVGMYLR